MGMHQSHADLGSPPRFFWSNSAADQNSSRGIAPTYTHLPFSFSLAPSQPQIFDVIFKIATGSPSTGTLDVGMEIPEFLVTPGHPSSRCV